MSVLHQDEERRMRKGQRGLLSHSSFEHLMLNDASSSGSPEDSRASSVEKELSNSINDVINTASRSGHQTFSFSAFFLVKKVIEGSSGYMWRYSPSFIPTNPSFRSYPVNGFIRSHYWPGHALWSQYYTETSPIPKPECSLLWRSKQRYVCWWPDLPVAAEPLL